MFTPYKDPLPLGNFGGALWTYIRLELRSECMRVYVPQVWMWNTIETDDIEPRHCEPGR